MGNGTIEVQGKRVAMEHKEPCLGTPLFCSLAECLRIVSGFLVWQVGSLLGLTLTATEKTRV